VGWRAGDCGAVVSGWALRILDLVGICAFEITGALVGVRKKLDRFGIQVLALVTGLGGGSSASNASTSTRSPYREWRHHGRRVFQRTSKCCVGAPAASRKSHTAPDQVSKEPVHRQVATLQVRFALGGRHYDPRAVVRITPSIRGRDAVNLCTATEPRTARTARVRRWPAITRRSLDQSLRCLSTDHLNASTHCMENSSCDCYCAPLNAPQSTSNADEARQALRGLQRQSHRSRDTSGIVGKQCSFSAANQRVRGSSPWRRTSIEAQADIAICSWAFVLSTTLLRPLFAASPLLAELPATGVSPSLGHTSEISYGSRLPTHPCQPEPNNWSDAVHAQTWLPPTAE
jgi:hypothetical protein